MLTDMSDRRSINKRILRNDIILIVALLLIAALIGLYLNFFRTKGDVVEVKVDGKHYATYSLTENITHDIKTGDEGLNRLIIRDGKAYVERATCPDGICAAHRPIYRNGESIICLPHKVVITVVSAGSDDGPDIVA